MSIETIEQFLDLFPARRQNSPTDWHVPCPAHDDNVRDPAKFSCHVTLVGHKILLKCFAGCGNDAVLRKIDRTEADLFLRSNGTHAPREQAATPEPTPTLVAFAALKGLTQSVLETCGWRNHDDGIAIPYQQRDGSLWRWRQRMSMRPGAGFKWDGQKERELIPYGRHRLDQVMEKGELWLVEGESDAVTAWAHGLPCLGIPGNLAVKCLTAEDLVGIETLWILREPGQSGNGFIGQMREHLPAIAYTGTARVVVLPAKDLSDLHVLMRAEFWPRLRQAQETAVDLFDPATTTTKDETSAPVLFGIGLGQFLAQEFPAEEPYIEGILSSDGPGWIAGEEKLGKTIYALAEALSLALAVPLCGRFAIPARRRVLFIEEEDSPRRTHVRLRALLRGHGRDPDDPEGQADLDTWFRVAVWQGFTFNRPEMVARLEATIAALRPAVVYLDVLRKLTTKSVRDDADMSPILLILDDLRRTYGCLFRVVHHFRKLQGFRAGRGSQELGGSYVLGAWGENSIFLEPVGRKQGAVKVEVQQKDGAPLPAFRLTIESEGPRHAPTRLRLVAADAPETDTTLEDLLLQALATLDPTPATDIDGTPGVTVAQLARALKKSDKTIRRTLKPLVKATRVLDTGRTDKQEVLYRVNE